METRLTRRPGQAGTKKYLARYGERLVCVRYLYDERNRCRHKTIELIVETVPWEPNARRPRRGARLCFVSLLAHGTGPPALVH